MLGLGLLSLAWPCENAENADLGFYDDCFTFGPAPIDGELPRGGRLVAGISDRCGAPGALMLDDQAIQAELLFVARLWRVGDTSWYAWPLPEELEGDLDYRLPIPGETVHGQLHLQDREPARHRAAPQLGPVRSLSGTGGGQYCGPSARNWLAYSWWLPAADHGEVLAVLETHEGQAVAAGVLYPNARSVLIESDFPPNWSPLCLQTKIYDARGKHIGTFDHKCRPLPPPVYKPAITCSSRPGNAGGLLAGLLALGLLRRRGLGPDPRARERHPKATLPARKTR